MENLDSTIIVTALPQMALSFGADPVGLNIGVTAYTLTLAVVIPIGGGWGIAFDAGRVFAAAIAIFTGASVPWGFSQGQWSFTGCRVLQNAGGATVTQVGRPVMLRATEKRDLVRLISYVALSGLVAPVLGLSVGGAITTYLGWGWIFNLPLGLGFAAGWRNPRNAWSSRSPRAPRPRANECGVRRDGRTGNTRSTRAVSTWPSPPPSKAPTTHQKTPRPARSRPHRQ
jgi:MFS family permease